MSSPLVKATDCCQPCSSVVTVQVPGPAGADGPAGAAGENGSPAYTLTTAEFIMPAEGATVTVLVGDSNWATVGQIVFVEVAGYMEVTAKPTAVSVTLENLENTASGLYTGNAAPTTAIPLGSDVSPGGLQGPTGPASSDTLDDLSPTTTKGDLMVDSGTNNPAADVNRFAVGSNGRMLCADSAQALGVVWSPVVPNAATDNAIVRFDGTTGKPVPVQDSAMLVTDSGDLQISTGNAKGANATDLQSQRGAATQVASGTRSVVSGGNSNTASGTETVVAGGISNVSSGNWAAISGGKENEASGIFTTVAGGQENAAAAPHATVGGGFDNEASASLSTIAGGSENVASQSYSTVGGGSENVSSGDSSVVSGGYSNEATGDWSTVSGGENNTASSLHSTVIGGAAAVSNKCGQVSHAAGFFTAVGDAQHSWLLFRNSTADGTPTVLYLDGAGEIAVVPVDTSWAFRGQVIARKDDGSNSIFEISGGIKNIAGVTSLIGAAVVANLVNDGTAYAVAVTADNTTDSLVITVTGQAATDLRWVCSLELTEVKY